MIFTRKLTRKSLMKFGRYHDLTVGKVLDQDHFDYLLWAYYHCSQINFDEDILDILHISKEWQIEKPGTDLMIYDMLVKHILENYDDGLRHKLLRNSQKKPIKHLHYGEPDRYIEKKGIMQARNQGKL